MKQSTSFAQVATNLLNVLQGYTKSIRFVAVLTMLLIVGIGQAWGETTNLTQSIIYSTGSAATGYASYTFTVDGRSWNAYAIKNQHSNATKDQHYLQIKKYASSTAYYIQIPTMPGKITSIKMTVGSTQQPMSGGENTATLYFSNKNSTSATGTGVASGTGDKTVTIDCSALNLTSGYITASAGVRIWDVAVTYETAATKLATPTNLKVADVTTTSATLSWDAVTYASGYTVTVGSTPHSANTNSISLNSLTPSTTYKWSVVAKGNGSTYTDSESAKGSDFTTDTPKKYTVTWMVDKEKLSTEDVYEGAKWSSLTLPTAPNPNDYCGQVFAGWTTTNIGSTGLDKDNDATAIQNLNLMTSENKSSKTNTITGDITFYAVFADYANE